MFMVQLSDIYITVFKYLLRKNSCLISLLTVKVPAAKTDLLGRLWPAASLCYMVTKDGLTAVEHQICAKSSASDAGCRDLTFALKMYTDLMGYTWERLISIGPETTPGPVSYRCHE